MRRFFALLYFAIMPYLWMMVPASSACVVTNPPAGGIYDSTILTGWGVSNVTRAPNQAEAPDCTVTAPSIIEDTSTQHHGAFVNVAGTITARPYTFTGYAKQLVGTRNVRAEIASSDILSLVSLIVNLPACTVQASNPTTEGSWSVGTASGSATLIANGWCKFSVTVTPTPDTSVYMAISVVNGTQPFYTGDGKSSLVAWGADLR
jgi:hypothetical protein